MLLDTLRQVARHLSSQARGGFLLVLALAVVNSLLELVLVAVTAVFGSALLSPERFLGRERVLAVLRAVHFPCDTLPDLLLGTGLLALLAVGVRALMGLAKTYADARYISWCHRTLSLHVFESLLRSPYSWHLERNTTTKVKAVHEDLHSVKVLLVACLQLASDTMILTVIFVALLVKNGPAVVSVFLLVGLLGRALHKAVNRKLTRLAAQDYALTNRSLQILSQSFHGLKDVQVAGCETVLEEQYRQVRQAGENIYSRAELYRAVPRYLMEILGFLALVGVSAGVSRLGLSPEQLASNLTILAVSFIRVLPAANRILIYLGLLTHCTPPTRAALDLLESARPLRPSGPAPEAIVSVELRRVTFQYPGGDAPALVDVDVSLERNERIAFVGRSGSGKTTLADVIAGLLPPARGEILVNGRTLPAPLPQTYPGRVGYVLQEPFLLEATVGQNITMSFAAGESERIWECLRAAQLEDVVRAYPAGLETEVGERGLRLSGGQAQRLAIARSLYHDPDLLILDEATSALDSLTEAAFLATLERLRGKHTLVIIAHRLSTVMSCDRIYVLAEGRVLASGRHLELLESCPTYRELVEAQQLQPTTI